jgi:hypothetical protein
MYREPRNTEDWLLESTSRNRIDEDSNQRLLEQPPGAAPRDHTFSTYFQKTTSFNFGAVPFGSNQQRFGSLNSLLFGSSQTITFSNAPVAQPGGEEHGSLFMRKVK